MIVNTALKLFSYYICLSRCFSITLSRMRDFNHHWNNYGIDEIVESNDKPR